MLTVDNLHVRFATDDGEVQAVNGVSFQLERGETIGIVGESGSGKSVTALSILGLIPQPPGKITNGRVLFQGKDLLRMSRRELDDIRGRRIAMIFQDPMTALNPFLTVEEQIAEVTRRHLNYSAAQSRENAIELLERVGIPNAAARVDDYPHQFSGGMRQRVMIAMALACKPDVLIADEPTTALDVTIQAQILDLIRELQEKEGTAVMLITHALGVVAGVCKRVLVMYGGQVVEEAPVEQLFARPRHPYTLGLLKSIPRWDERSTSSQPSALPAIVGQPPNMAHPPGGCPFHPRCPYKLERCEREMPPLTPRPDEGRFACFVNVEEVAPREPAHG